MITTSRVKYFFLTGLMAAAGWFMAAGPAQAAPNDSCSVYTQPYKLCMTRPAGSGLAWRPYSCAEDSLDCYSVCPMKWTTALATLILPGINQFIDGTTECELFEKLSDGDKDAAKNVYATVDGVWTKLLPNGDSGCCSRPSCATSETTCPSSGYNTCQCELLPIREGNHAKCGIRTALSTSSLGVTGSAEGGICTPAQVEAGEPGCTSALAPEVSAISLSAPLRSWDEKNYCVRACTQGDFDCSDAALSKCEPCQEPTGSYTPPTTSKQVCQCKKKPGVNCNVEIVSGFSLVGTAEKSCTFEGCKSVATQNGNQTACTLSAADSYWDTCDGLTTFEQNLSCTEVAGQGFTGSCSASGTTLSRTCVPVCRTDFLDNPDWVTVTQGECRDIDAGAAEVYKRDVTTTLDSSKVPCTGSVTPRVVQEDCEGPGALPACDTTDPTTDYKCPDLSYCDACKSPGKARCLCNKAPGVSCTGLTTAFIQKNCPYTAPVKFLPVGTACEIRKTEPESKEPAKFVCVSRLKPVSSCSQLPECAAPTVCVQKKEDPRCTSGGLGAVEGSSAEKGAIELPNPFGSSDPRRVLGMFIQLFIGVSGTAALGAFIYGGYTWMTSEGDKMKVEKGKNIFKWATIGLFLIFMAYALVNQLLTFLGVQ